MSNEYNTRIGIMNHDPVCINMLYIDTTKTIFKIINFILSILSLRCIMYLIFYTI